MIISIKKAVCYIAKNRLCLMFIIPCHIIKGDSLFCHFFKCSKLNNEKPKFSNNTSRIDVSLISMEFSLFCAFPYTTKSSLVPNSLCPCSCVGGAYLALFHSFKLF